MEHPVGLPLYWCRDRRARRDTRRGVGPVGRDLIVTRLVVATRFLVVTRFAVATLCPATIRLVSRCPSPSRWVGFALRTFCGAESFVELYCLGRDAEVVEVFSSRGSLGESRLVSGEGVDGTPVLGCQSVVAPKCVASRPRGVSGVQGGSVCRPSTLWRSEVAVLVVCGFSARFVCTLQVGCSCCCVVRMASVVTRRVRAVVALLALDSLAVVFPMWRTGAGKSRCFVCRVASLVEHCDTCLWLLSAWCWLVVSSGEVLSEFFSVGSGESEGLRYAVVLAGAFWPVFPERCLGGSGGGSHRTGLRCFCSSACCSVLSEGPCCLVVWVVRSGEGSSQNRPLSFLAEVLPRSTLCSFRATVVLSLWFKVCCLVGLCSGEVLPGRLLALLVEVLPKAALCLFWLLLLSLCRDELSLLSVGLSVLQSAWALLIECCALGRASGCRVGQVALLFVSECLGCASGTLCVPVAQMVFFVFLNSLGCVSPSSAFRWLLGVVMLHCGVVSLGCTLVVVGVACCALSGLRFFACGFWQVSYGESFLLAVVLFRPWVHVRWAFRLWDTCASLSLVVVPLPLWGGCFALPRAHRDTRRGVAPVGCDLIATRLVVAIRVTIATHFLVVTGFAVATLCPAAIRLVSRCPSPLRCLLGLSWVTSQRFGMVLLCLPRLFARGVESFVELSCLGWDVEVVEVFSSRGGLGYSLAVSSLCGRRWSGLVWTRASGGFRSASSRFRSPVLGCQSVVAPACVASRPRGVSGVRGGSVCRPSTLWRSEVAVLVVRRRSRMVVTWSQRVCQGLLPLCA
ncbi:hypothetical protein Taro_003380 [Colocasia esculenta]|uniref:Uncharacterized protein n=1 Tax=Colocasia esculenta TaxID=4460 RepID=A0A843TNF1_COLES|nr:hypothetical protein [Colocasia esculenta]